MNLVKSDSEPVLKPAVQAPNKRVILTMGGKGGVGKTTWRCAWPSGCGTGGWVSRCLTWTPRTRLAAA